MQTTSEQYIVDAQDQRLSVVVDFDYYQKLLARLEELEEIYAFDLAEESQDEAIPFSQAIS
jgi:tetrahydromethanopterin S-methyltransferase subunit G